MTTEKTNKKPDTFDNAIFYGSIRTKSIFRNNPALIFAAMCIAFTSEEKASWYIPHGRQAYAKRVRKTLLLLNANIDTAIKEVVERGRGKLKADTLEALQDWKRKLPALLELEALVKPMLQGIPLITVYNNPSSRHVVSLESPQQAAWRLATELVLEIRRGQVGEHVAHGIADKTFAHLHAAKLLTKRQRGLFVLAARDSKRPIPKMGDAPKKKAKAKKPVETPVTNLGDVLKKSIAANKAAKAEAAPQAEAEAPAEAPAPPKAEAQAPVEVPAPVVQKKGEAPTAMAV